MAAIGIGGEYAAISSAVVEFVPKRVSGKTDAFIISLWPVGAICSATLVILALRFFPAEIAWRAGFLSAVALAAFALYIRRNLPESPRWLIGRHRFGDAEAIVAEAVNEVMKRKGLKELPHAGPIIVRQGVSGLWPQTKELFSKYLARGWR